METLIGITAILMLVTGIDYIAGIRYATAFKWVGTQVVSTTLLTWPAIYWNII